MTACLDNQLHSSKQARKSSINLESLKRLRMNVLRTAWTTKGMVTLSTWIRMKLPAYLRWMRGWARPSSLISYWEEIVVYPLIDGRRCQLRARNKLRIK